MLRHRPDSLTKFFGSILVLALILTLLVAPRLAAGQGTQTLYVAPDGNDADAGTLAQPLATFAGARDRVRTLLATTDDDIIVNFRGGTYTFTETVTLGAQDSGSPTQSVTYQRYQNETPIFSSLVPVTGWTTHSGNIMQADLPTGISHVRYLQDASENWMPRSATAAFVPAENTQPIDGEPQTNEGLAFEPSAQAAKFYTKYPSGWAAPDWGDAAQYDLRMTNESWLVNVLPVVSADSTQNRINVSVPATYQMKNCTADCSQAEAWVLNSLAGIDSPGEWAALNGKIYLWPQSGTADIYAPQLTELIRIDAGGDGNTWTGTPVQHITIDGITFTGGDFYMRKFDANNRDNPAFTDVTSQHDWGVVDVPAGMLQIRNASNITVKNSTFTKSGGGLRLDRHAQQIKIQNNAFSFLGREAISLMGRGPGYGDVLRDNEISHNVIQSTGREKWDAPAIHLSQASNNHIHHNFIADTHFSAYQFTSSRGIYIAGKAYENVDATYMGTEAHHWEVASVAIDHMVENIDQGEAPFVTVHQYLYNYNNLFEKNVVTDAHNGDQFYGTAVLSNGAIYSSGGTYQQTNTLQLNYLFDIRPKDTQLYYQDDYAENIDVLKNMVHNYGLADPQEGVLFDTYLFPEAPATGRGLIQSNAVQSATYDFLVGGVDRGNVTVQGNIDFTSNNPAGDAAYVNDYIEMYNVLCEVPTIVPAGVSVSGLETFKSNLGAKISGFGGTVPTCSSPNPTPTPVPTVRKIHPIGDSITEGEYRYELFKLLIDANYAFDFVGTLQTFDDYPPYNGIPFDEEHDGHTGQTSSYVNSNITSWLNNFTPDIALIHLGTNDIEEILDGVQGASIANTVGQIDSIIAKLRADNPTVTILLAQLIPVQSEMTDYNNLIVQLNGELATLATNRTTTASSVTIVDMHTGFGDTDLADSFHPNTVGAQKMAQRWRDAIINSSLPPTPTPIPTHTPTATPPPTNSWIAVDDRDSAVTYSGAWSDLAIESAAQGTVKWGTEAGAQASFTYSGATVRVYIWRYDEEQTFNVLLDGQQVATVTVPAGDEGSFMAWESPSTRAVTRTVTVEVGEGELHLDGFAYQSVPTVATLSEQGVQPNQSWMIGIVLIGLVVFGLYHLMRLVECQYVPKPTGCNITDIIGLIWTDSQM